MDNADVVSQKRPTINVQIAELVEAALEQPVAERAQFVANACSGDAELRREVESLLCQEEKARDFIEQPAYEQAPDALLDRTGKLTPGQQLESYSIISLLGLGGMGEVYLAEDRKLGRQVAIKLVKGGFETSSFLRHFRNEERILAGLNHPNIAHLYGGGITGDGLPYYVMEYVEGERIDDYCRKHQLTLEQRLQLFREVCGAVAYAHQHLVIHRDLKPANIWVTASGASKLLDFGIAKLLDPETESLSEQTITLQALMTPDYASPEQVLGGNMSTASDVYSLGVVLYELLTGERPYRIKARRPDEVVRVISQQEPARPSTIVRESRIVNRESDDSRVTKYDSRSLRGDLDNIVLKALRKEPERRYSSAGQLSEDIRRYLEGLPVRARKDTFGYRAAKFAARNRVAVTAAVLVILAIIAGLVLVLWQSAKAREQRDLAEREKIKAERINVFLQRMLSFSNQSITSVSPVAQRKDVTVNEMLDQIAPQIETELHDQPEVRAQVLRTIGSAYASQGRYEEAEKNLRAALAVQTRLNGSQSADAAAIMVELGVLSFRQFKLEEAERLLEKTVSIYRLRRKTHSTEYNPSQLALALDYLASVKFFHGDTKLSRSLMEEAVQISSGANLQGREREIRVFNKGELGALLVAAGDLERGETLLREALVEYRELSRQPHWEQGVATGHLGIVALRKNHLDDAEKYLRESEQILRQTLGQKNFYLAGCLNRRAILSFRKNDLKAAETMALESLDMMRDTLPGNKLMWAGPMQTLGDILIKTGRAREGEDYYRQALAIYEQQTTKNYTFILPLKIRLSQFLLEQDRLVEAKQMAQSADQDARQHLTDDATLRKMTASNLTQILEEQGKRDAAPTGLSP